MHDSSSPPPLHDAGNCWVQQPWTRPEPDEVLSQLTMEAKEGRRVIRDAMHDRKQNMGCLPSSVRDFDFVRNGMDGRPLAQPEESPLHHGGFRRQCKNVGMRTVWAHRPQAELETMNPSQMQMDAGDENQEEMMQRWQSKGIQNT